MKKIIVASTNPVKIKATLKGFQQMFPKEIFEIKGVSVDPNVKDQPMTDQETLQGAENRVNNAIKKHPGFNYYAGLEGGLEKQKGEIMSFSWVVVKSKQAMGKGRSAAYFLPPKISKLIEAGKELGDAMDQVYNTKNIKQKDGAIGLLTDNVIDRTNLYTPAVIIALIPFKKKSLYK